jgi:hypothetical protein
MDIFIYFHKSYLCGVSPLWAMMSQADACSYCMGSAVSISSKIYLYSSYFASVLYDIKNVFLDHKIMNFVVVKMKL